MKRRFFLAGTFGALLAGRPCAAERAPLQLILCLPANIPESQRRPVLTDIASLQRDGKPGDRLVLVNAFDQSVVADITYPAELPADDDERSEALTMLFGPALRFVGAPDMTAPVNDIEIPRTLRALRNIVTRFPGSDRINVVMIGSMLWQNKKDANFSMRTHRILDGFLLVRSPFGLVGEETWLARARVSILATDRPEDFFSSQDRKRVAAFWGKSIVGRGGTVGAIETYGPASSARFAATDEDLEPYAIDRTQPAALETPDFVPVPVLKPEPLKQPNQGQTTNGNSRPVPAAPRRGRPVGGNASAGTAASPGGTHINGGGGDSGS